MSKVSQSILWGSYKKKSAEELETFGYVGNSLEIALWWFYHTEDFKSGMEMVVNLGGDSDTLAAITGSIAEAAYGIPEWIKDKAFSYLDEPLKEVLRRWEETVVTK